MFYDSDRDDEAELLANDPRIATLYRRAEVANLQLSYSSHFRDGSAVVHVRQAVATLQAAERDLNAILSADYPTLWAEVEADRRAELEKRWREIQLRDAALGALTAVENFGIAQRDRVDAEPLPARFNHLVWFAQKRLEIPTDQMPPIGLVSSGSLIGKSGGPVAGLHIVPSDRKHFGARIFVDDGLDDEEIATTVIHELAHHADWLREREPTEARADAATDRIWREWRQDHDARALR